MKKLLVIFTTILFFFPALKLHAATLEGWAEMPQHTYAEGPSTGQFNFDVEVVKNKQVVQGFSAVLNTNTKNRFYFLDDNGFGKKNNSADALIRIYEMHIDFNTVNHKTGYATPISYINVRDPDKYLTFKIQADFNQYYNTLGNSTVDKSIRDNRLLTGADIDPESLRTDKNGHIWLGDEFGPFLIKLDSSGKVLRPEISLPNVVSPDNPTTNNLKPNLPSSGGFEGMAINPSGDFLYPMLEASVMGDVNKTLRIYQFDVNSERYTDIIYRYRLDEKATNIGDFVAVNSHEFLVLERNSASQAKDKPFKKVFLIDIDKVDEERFVQKRMLVDLMELNDPNDLDNDRQLTYAFAYSHIENMLIIDKNTLLIANDNNYAGRTYFIKIKLDQVLSLADFPKPNIINTNQININNLHTFGYDLGDHSFFGWMTVLFYFFATIRTTIKAKLTYLNKENCYFWLSITILLIFLGINKQLDLQSNLTDWLRASAKAHGWYEQRRSYQMLFVSLMGVAIPLLLVSLRLFLYQSWQRYQLTWVGIVLLLIFVIVRAASFHHVDIVFYKTVGSIRYYQALEMMAISIIIVGTFFENKKIRPLAKANGITNTIVNIGADGDTVSCPCCGQKPLALTKHGRVFKCKSCQHMYETRVSDESTFQPH